MDVSAVMAAANITDTRRLLTFMCRASTRHTATVTGAGTMDMAAAGVTANSADITAGTTFADTITVTTEESLGLPAT